MHEVLTTDFNSRCMQNRMHVVACDMGVGSSRHLIHEGVWAVCVCVCRPFSPCTSKALCRLAGSSGGFPRGWSCCRQKPPYSLRTLLPPRAPGPLCPLRHKHTHVASKTSDEWKDESEVNGKARDSWNRQLCAHAQTNKTCEFTCSEWRYSKIPAYRTFTVHQSFCDWPPSLSFLNRSNCFPVCVSALLSVGSTVFRDRCRGTDVSYDPDPPSFVLTGSYTDHVTSLVERSTPRCKLS